MKFLLTTLSAVPLFSAKVVQFEHAAQNFCLQPTNTDFSTNIQPQHNTDSEKFLFPILKWGPTNQVHGLFESIKG